MSLTAFHLWWAPLCYTQTYFPNLAIVFPSEPLDEFWKVPAVHPESFTASADVGFQEIW